MFRTAVSSTRVSRLASSIRLLHATPVASKTVTETVKDVADTLNKKAGKGLASAIDKGEEATETVKETVGATTKDAKKKADETSKVAGQKLNQASAGAKQAKEDFTKEVKK